METREAIFRRRSVRVYNSTPISDQDLTEILEAGLAAPSAVNYQPWYFVVIRSPEQMRKLAEVMGRVSKAIEPNLRERFSKHPDVVEATIRFIHQMGDAPVSILAFQLRPDYSKTAETIIQSVAAALENILLAATDKGIGSCWLTAPNEAGVGAELRETFAPGKGDLVAMVTLGYPAQEPNAPKRRADRYIII